MGSHFSIPLPMVLPLPKRLNLSSAQFSSSFTIQFSGSPFQKISADFCFLNPRLCAKHIKISPFYFIINFLSQLYRWDIEAHRNFFNFSKGKQVVKLGIDTKPSGYKVTVHTVLHTYLIFIFEYLFRWSYSPLNCKFLVGQGSPLYSSCLSVSWHSINVNWYRNKWVHGWLKFYCIPWQYLLF